MQPGMQISIRSATLTDAAPLSRLLRQIGYFHALETQSHEETKTQVERHLAQCLSDYSHLVLVAEDENFELLGYAAVHWLPYLFLPGAEGFVSELFVNAMQRGQGVGSALLGRLVDESKKRGCSRLSLLNMRKRESYQRGFYSLRGWEERSEAANFVFWL
jgi:GNAT superfamily N-acetyltransferase